MIFILVFDYNSDKCSNTTLRFIDDLWLLSTRYTTSMISTICIGYER